MDTDVCMGGQQPCFTRYLPSDRVCQVSNSRRIAGCEDPALDYQVNRSVQTCSSMVACCPRPPAAGHPRECLAVQCHSTYFGDFNFVETLLLKSVEHGHGSPNRKGTA